MNIAIIGGSGFLGKNLALHLLKTTDWNIRIVSHTSKPFKVADKYESRLEFVIGDVLDHASITSTIRGMTVAYYFVHMMGQKNGDFYQLELKAAKTFGKAAKRAGLKRLIYMGGLGAATDTLSDHLMSRQRTGQIFRSLPIEVIELRASMIIGEGSVGFDIICNLVRTLPVMPLPKTANTLTQPIALGDALLYLQAAATVKIKSNIIVEIGGPDILSYEDIYRRYAAQIGKKRLIIRVPFLQPQLEARFLDYFTPQVHSRIGKAMVESLGNEMIVTGDTARILFPAIRPQPIKMAFKHGIA